MINIQVDDRQVLDALQQLQRKMSNLQPAMDDIGQSIVSLIQQHMGRGETSWGEAFEPLKMRTGVPLNDTRQHIYNRITHRATANSATIGLFDSESNKIGRVHQFGATIVPKNKPLLVFQPRGSQHPIFAKQVTIPPGPSCRSATAWPIFRQIGKPMCWMC